MLFTAILSIFLCFLENVKSQGVVENTPGTESCQFEYLVQPPEELYCNPYINAELKLECEVSILVGVPLTGKLHVDWFHSLHPTSNIQIDRILRNYSEDIIIRKEMIENGTNMIVRSHLEVKSLKAFDSGKYWCRIRDPLLEQMFPSDSVVIKHPTMYSNSNPCSRTSAQSKQERKCALQIFNSSVPQSTPSSSSTSSLQTSSANSESPSFKSLMTPSEIQTNSTVNASPGTTDGETTSFTSEKEMEFYITVAILIVFGLVIAVLLPLVVYLTVKYRKMLKARRLNTVHQVIPSSMTQIPSTLASDYLVPLSLADQRMGQTLQIIQSMRADNPLYMSNIRQQFTTFWLQQQQQQQQPERLEMLEHSYETMTHDYEDMFAGSVNVERDNPMLMKWNEAYSVSSSTLKRQNNFVP